MGDFSSLHSLVLPQFKRIISKSTIPELKTIEEIQSKDLEKYNKIPENERIKLRIVTKDMEDERLENSLKQCVEENKSKYSYKR